MNVVYTTVAGRIVHEKRGGVQRFYGDTSGNKTDLDWPYGKIRSHTGSSTAPFTIVGTLGYYMDQITQFYIRARYLTTNLARWLTVDQLWPNKRAHGYVNSASIYRHDPMGLGSVTRFWGRASHRGLSTRCPCG